MYRIVVHGVVQGVGFRPSVKRAADHLGSGGFVRNDGSHVTIETDTDPETFMAVVADIVGPMARIDDWSSETIESDPAGLDDFVILQSTEGDRDSSLPPDTAICERCLEEMLDPENRRYGYPFTNCTDCGARYTLIDGLPYDRERTSMSRFDMCPECKYEYSDKKFRRFHAQTLSCPVNGPKYRYLGKGLEEMGTGYDSFRECAFDISKGKIVIVKGWGGMHIICSPDRLTYLREWYGRPYKPFAVMARDLDTVRSFAEVTEYALPPLVSPAKPVVLLKKREDVDTQTASILENVSPGIGTVGTFLPYSGIHHLLFKELEEIGNHPGWIIMTSANPPGEPMALDIESASDMNADGYLVHDRKISARCDDSVIVPHPFGPETALSRAGPFDIRSFPIRKARGLIPDPVEVPHDRELVSFGAERNVTVTVTRGGKAFTSPYIGNSRHPGVLDHAFDTAQRFMDLFGVKDPECVCADLHPRYGTISLASRVAEERSVPLHRFQHHEAHAASLLVDSGLEEMPVLILDGVGYGSDGLPWGGEVIESSFTGFERSGHLEYFGLPGGDASVYHPERIAHWLTREAGFDLPLNDEILEKILTKTHEDAILTSSMGRLLDAMSALLLGVTWRTYDGEPAMRLETLLSSSSKPETEMFRIPIRGRMVDITGRWKILLEELFRGDQPSIGKTRKESADLAMGMVSSVVNDLVSIGIDTFNGDRSEEGSLSIGMSGGVAYDLPIVKSFIDSCKELGAYPVLHSRIPPGDGGISTGQSVLGGILKSEKG